MANEIVSQTEGYTGATRPAWTPATATTGSIDNLASAAQMTIATSGTLNVTGAALLTSSQRGGTTGRAGVGLCLAAPRVFQAGDLHELLPSERNGVSHAPAPPSTASLVKRTRPETTWRLPSRASDAPRHQHQADGGLDNFKMVRALPDGGMVALDMGIVKTIIRKPPREGAQEESEDSLMTDVPMLFFRHR